MDKLYTVTTAAPLLGLKINSLRKLAIKEGIGIQPGGPGTPRYFTIEMLHQLRECRKYKWQSVEEGEDREALGLPPIYEGLKRQG